MNACALSGAWDVVWRVGWCEHLVDDVDDSIACVDISSGNGCTIDHDAVTDSERERLSIHGGCRHALRNSRCWNGTRDNVVEQDVCESGLPFRCIKCCQVDASISKGLVGWCEERERAVALEGFKQFSLDDCGHEGIVNARALSGAWDVVWRGGWRQHLVDDVDDSVAGGHICCGNGGSVHHHAVTYCEGKWVSIHGVGRQAIGDC